MMPYWQFCLLVAHLWAAASVILTYTNGWGDWEWVLPAGIALAYFWQAKSDWL